MRDPAKLPSELAGYIFDCATNGSRDVKLLANFCSVSQQWHIIAKPLLYRRWTYHGEKHSVRSLWKFLCTMIRDNGTAGLVRSVDARNWALLPEDLGPGFEIAEDEVVHVKEAFREAGMNETAEYIKIGIRQGDRTAFMALLFTRLPNLSTLSAHVPAIDFNIIRLLRQAIMDHNDRPAVQAFQNLKELTVLSEWSDNEWLSWRIPRDLYKLDLSNMPEIFSLPRLEKLSILDLNVNGTLRYCGSRSGTSSIKNLTLINHREAAATASETQAILAMPKALNSLSFYQNDCYQGNPEAGHPVSISNQQLFSALELHRKSLESLDIYRDCTSYSLPIQNKSLSYFGSLREFERLKNLCIQTEALLGVDGESRGSFHLKNTLPAGLESLTLYGFHGLIENLDLHDQFREILLSDDFPHLKLVTFEELSEFVDPISKSRVTKLHVAVKEFCKEAMVTLQVQNGRDLPKGGKQLPWVTRARKMRRVRERWRNRAAEQLTDRVYVEDDLSDFEFLSDFETISGLEYDMANPGHRHLDEYSEGMGSGDNGAADLQALSSVDWGREQGSQDSEDMDLETQSSDGNAEDPSYGDDLRSQHRED